MSDALALMHLVIAGLVNGMRLPNAHRVVIDLEKIREFNSIQPVDTEPAWPGFFRQFGFELAAWEILAEALRAHARLRECVKTRLHTEGVE